MLVETATQSSPELNAVVRLALKSVRLQPHLRSLTTSATGPPALSWIGEETGRWADRRIEHVLQERSGVRSRLRADALAD
jgi:hypothetical protein